MSFEMYYIFQCCGSGMIYSQFYLYALSLFAGSGSGTLIPDPDPGKSSGSMRIRIHNTASKSYDTSK